MLAYPNLDAFATGTMSARSCAMAAWCAAERHPTLIIYASLKSARLAARSATSSPSPFAADIIVSFIATAMRPHGGRNLGWIRLPPLEHFGWDCIRCENERRELRLQNQLLLWGMLRAHVNDQHRRGHVAASDFKGGSNGGHRDLFAQVRLQQIAANHADLIREKGTHGD